VKSIDPSHILVETVHAHLKERGQLKRSGPTGKLAFYCSHAPQVFEKKIQFLMGIENPMVTLVRLIP
jgi:glutamate racemase